MRYAKPVIQASPESAGQLGVTVHSAAPKLKIAPLETTVSLRTLAYEAIKKAIMEMDIYGHPYEIRLDERQLSQDLGVSRTPIREALTLLEQEGFARSMPRRGIFVVRKSKREIIDLILVWAALESMAARLPAQRAGAPGNAGSPPSGPGPRISPACGMSSTSSRPRNQKSIRTSTRRRTSSFTRPSSGSAAAG